MIDKHIQRDVNESLALSLKFTDIQFFGTCVSGIRCNPSNTDLYPDRETINYQHDEMLASLMLLLGENYAVIYYTHSNSGVWFLSAFESLGDKGPCISVEAQNVHLLFARAHIEMIANMPPGPIYELVPSEILGLSDAGVTSVLVTGYKLVKATPEGEDILAAEISAEGTEVLDYLGTPKKGLVPGVQYALRCTNPGGLLSMELVEVGK